MRRQHEFHRQTIVACALALAISGCAGSSLTWRTIGAPAIAAANASTPRVQDCINIDSASGSGTPAKYVCNGKVYTSRELFKTRQDSAAVASSNKS